MSSIADSFLAHVRFLNRAEGGRSRAAKNPAVSQLLVPPFQTSCRIVAVDTEGTPLSDQSAIPLGETILARVVVWSATYCTPELECLGPEIEFFEGSKLVARGKMMNPGQLEPTPQRIKRFIRTAIS